MHWIFVVQLVSTLFMTGLIWFIQIVHYPLLAAVGSEGFCNYEHQHRLRTTWVVAPAMLAEALSAVWLVDHEFGTEQAWLAWIGMGLVLLIWVTTAVWSVPAHERLTSGFDESALRRLVATNWIRTVGWSARSALVLAMLIDGFGRHPTTP